MCLQADDGIEIAIRAEKNPMTMNLPRVDQAPPPRGALLYVLAEPDNALVCYVGQTRQPRRRFLGHLRSGRLWLDAMREPARPESSQQPLPLGQDELPMTWNARPPRQPRALEEWLALLISEHRVPRMRCIESVACEARCGCTFVSDCKRARNREAWWIGRLLIAGHPLLNRTVPQTRQHGDGGR